jgi:hypothetical protein
MTKNSSSPSSTCGKNKLKAYKTWASQYDVKVVVIEVKKDGEL